MILSDKYKIEETTLNLTLYEHKLVTAPKTKETSMKWVIVGYYSPTWQGRSQVYNRVLGREISKEENQDLKKILEIVKLVSEGISSGEITYSL